MPDLIPLRALNQVTFCPRLYFLQYVDACQLTESGRKTFFQAYEQRKATLVTHPVYGYRMSYARMLEVQARTLAGHVRGELPAYRGFVVR